MVWKCLSLNISTTSACDGDTTAPSATTGSVKLSVEETQNTKLENQTMKKLCLHNPKLWWNERVSLIIQILTKLH